MSELQISRDKGGALQIDLHNYEYGDSPILRLWQDTSGAVGRFGCRGHESHRYALHEALDVLADSLRGAADTLGAMTDDEYADLLRMLTDPAQKLAEVRAEGLEATNGDQELLSAERFEISKPGAPNNTAEMWRYVVMEGGVVRTYTDNRIAVGVGGASIRVYLGEGDNAVLFNIEPKETK